ncbi:MAG: hypothetical protein LM514_01845, partial [Streptococcus sp.]|nr:hypothetical protein [Streptococcus sp.]
LIKLVLIIAFLGVISCLYIYGRGLNGPPIRSDGFGYYAYLPSIFIDHNLSFRLAIENAPAGASLQYAYGIGTHPSTGKMFNKYTLGTAILWTPFFLIADAFAHLFDFPRTGYSPPYQIANIAAGIFFLCLGVIALFGTIQRKFGSITAFPVIVLVVFATNVFHYGTYDASFSHICSFAAISVYISLLLYYQDNPINSRLWQPIVIGLMLALITMIRAPNAIVGLLAVGIIYKKMHHLHDPKKTLRDFLFFILAFICGILPLLLYWRHAAGSLITDSYQIFPKPDGSLEGFYWSSPELANFLFSVKKGLFFWSPTVFLAFLALPMFLKDDKVLGVLIGITLCMHIYICSSWWFWSFGGSFGSRPFVDMMPIVALPLAVGVYHVRKLISDVDIWTLVSILVAINLILMLGYWHNYIPFDGTTVEILKELPKKLWCLCK